MALQQKQQRFKFYGVTNQIDFIIEDNKLKHINCSRCKNSILKGKIEKKHQKFVHWNFYDDIKKITLIYQKILLTLKI